MHYFESAFRRVPPRRLVLGQPRAALRFSVNSLRAALVKQIEVYPQIYVLAICATKALTSVAKSGTGTGDAQHFNR